MIPNTLPQSLVDNPRLDQWIAFAANRTVALKTGKVELGQGILTALRQIAAEELDLASDRLTIQPGDTELAPHEGFTAGSLSVEIGGGAVRLVCAEVRARLLAEAARQLNVEPEQLSLRDGVFLQGDRPTGLDYWSVAGGVDLAVAATDQ
jgi:nicotinate dehydrogenase subunit B